MKYSALILAFLLVGCCTTKDTIQTTQRDTVLVFKLSPVNVDSILAYYHFGYNPNCDTAEIIARYSSLLYFWQDSTANYRLMVDYLRTGKDSLAQRLRFAENREPIVKTVTVSTFWSQTQVQKTPFMTILGYIFVGFQFCIGVVIGIKAFL